MCRSRHRRCRKAFISSLWMVRRQNSLRTNEAVRLWITRPWPLGSSSPALSSAGFFFAPSATRLVRSATRQTPPRLLGNPPDSTLRTSLGSASPEPAASVPAPPRQSPPQAPPAPAAFTEKNPPLTAPSAKTADYPLSSLQIRIRFDKNSQANGRST